MLNRRVEIEKQDFRKLSSFSLNSAGHKASLKLPPTYPQCRLKLNIEDYRLLVE